MSQFLFLDEPSRWQLLLCCRMLAIANPTALRYQRGGRGRLQRSATCGNEGDVAPGSLKILLPTLSQVKREDRFVIGCGILPGFFLDFPRHYFQKPIYPQRYCTSKQAGKQAGRQASKQAEGGRTASHAASSQAKRA